jgi:glycosyltransferase involved in cell wall biosynthesis
MKVLHVITGLTAGGAERMLHNLMCSTTRKVVDPMVVSLMDAGKFGPLINNLGIPVITVGMKRGVPSLSGTIKLLKTTKQFKPDIVQGWMYHGNVAAHLVHRISAPKHSALLYNIRQTLYDIKKERPLTQKIIKLEARFSKKTSSVIYNTYVGARQHEEFGYDPTKTVVIPNGVDCNLFQKNTEVREATRNSLNISEENILIGIAARFHPMKNYPCFIRCAAKIHEEFPKTRFIMVGENVTTAEKEILALQQKYETANFIMPLGEWSKMLSFFNSLDILTSCSSWGEGFSNSIAEASACEVPCVVTDIGDSKEIIGGNGIVIPPDDDQALIDAWRNLIVRSATERYELGSKARSRILEKYSLPKIVQMYESLYSSLLVA